MIAEAPPDAADQDQPDVSRTTVAYRVAEGIVLRNWDFGNVLRAPPPLSPPPPVDETRRCQARDPVSQPVVSTALAAWECGRPGARNVEVVRYSGRTEEYELSSPAAVAGTGDQFAPSAFQALVAFVDGGDGGSVWLHDSTPASRTTRLVCPGNATGVSVGELGVGSGTVLAVTRASSGHDEDVEIWAMPWDGEGYLVTSLRVDGVQRNPHLSSDWVAFEDLSTNHAQVVLWQWTTGLVFIPNPSASNQTLNDLGVSSGDEVRAVFADDGYETDGNRDIALYQLTYVDGAIPDDGSGTGYPWLPPPPPPPPPPGDERPPPARCDDVDPMVLGVLELGRATGKPLASVESFEAIPFGDDTVLPVLICIDAERVTSGWVTVDDEAVANPSDFKRDLVHFEARAIAELGSARIAGTIAGQPGAWLVARVLADPGRPLPAPSATATSTSLRVASLSGVGGCGTAGLGGPLAGLALLLALRLRRR